MLKNYELLYILHPDLEGTSDKVSEKVAKQIAKLDGEVTNQEDWGKRKLAYKISKNDFGVYVLVNFKLPSEKLTEIERDLRLSEEVLRFMVVSVPELSDKPKPARRAPKTAEKVEEKVEKKVAKKEETPAEVTEVAEEKPKKTVAKKTTKKAEVVEEEVKAPKKAKKTDDSAKVEKARMKKLDEKLEEILGE